MFLLFILKIGTGLELILQLYLIGRNVLNTIYFILNSRYQISIRLIFLTVYLQGGKANPAQPTGSNTRYSTIDHWIQESIKWMFDSGWFGQSGLQRKKPPNCHKYATFFGGFLMFSRSIFFLKHCSVHTKKLHKSEKNIKESLKNRQFCFHFKIGLRKFSNLNVLHKYTLMQDWVSRLGT